MPKRIPGAPQKNTLALQVKKTLLTREDTSSRPKRKASSEFRGVRRKQGRRKWEARIKLDGKNFPLGFFDLQIDAALAYDKAARKLYGESARPNFV